MKKTENQSLIRERGNELDRFVRVKAAKQNNLKGIDIDIPRDSFVAFTGVSGSGKSSIAFGTIYAEAQRRYFESVAPYARRLISQLPQPDVMEIAGLPPAVALKQRRGEPTARSSVGTLTNLSNSLRMLFSRAGVYPEKSNSRLDSDAFSSNTLQGACQCCHGMGVVHTVSESSLVPDPALSISQKAIAAWPGAWQGKNYRDILAVLGYDIEKPWQDLSQEERDWILFTEEKPVVTVHAQREAHRIQRPYQGTYMSAAVYVRHTFATTNSATLRKRVAQFMDVENCTACKGKRLKAESLAVKFAGYDIADLTHLSLNELYNILAQILEVGTADAESVTSNLEVAKVLAADLMERIALLKDLGLDYLSMDRTTQTLSAGELQRLRLTTQLRSGLFGVVYVLDEPSAGLHPQDAEALLKTLWQLKAAGNSLFVVEHEMNIVRQADWIVDIGPDAGDNGGDLLYSGPVQGLESVERSQTRKFLFDGGAHREYQPRTSSAWFTLHGVNRHNLKDFSVEFPLGALTVVTGVSGSGKSTLVSQVLAETLQSQLGAPAPEEENDEDEEEEAEIEYPEDVGSASVEGIESIRRLVSVDQKPIGRTPRSNLATYTGLFDHVRKRFASTEEAKVKGFNAGRFSFNVVGGRCTTCDGEGFESVELMFLPSVYTPCAGCRGTRYNEDTLSIKYRGLNISQVLDMTVESALKFFTELPAVARALKTLADVGLGYLRLGQPATELSGGEAQRIKLANELQRVQDGSTLYLLDEPTTGLHPADIEKLMMQLHALVEGGNTVIVVEHDMDVVSQADWVIDLGPGAGKNGGKLVASGTPAQVADSAESRTAPFLSAVLNSR